MKVVKKKTERGAMTTRQESGTKNAEPPIPSTTMVKQLLEDAYPATQCPLCDHKSTTRTRGEAHYRENHKGQRGYHCMEGSCDQSFSSRPGLLYHLKAAHTIKKNVDRVVLTSTKTKEIGTKNTPLDANLIKQLEMHYDTLVCPLCNERFAKKTQTIIHINKHHPKEKLFQCFIKHCPHEQGFGSLQALIYHLSKH